MSETKRYTIQECFSLRARIGWQGLRSDEFLDSGAYLVTGTDFDNGRIDWDTCYHVSEERYRQDVGIQLKEHDLLITKDGTIGKTAVVQDCPDEATLNSGVFVVRAINNKVVPEFLHYVLHSQQFELFMRNILTGSTIKHLNQEHFYKFSFEAPDSDEQSKIAEILVTVDDVIDKTRALIEKYTNVKTGMMQDLLKRGDKTQLSKVCDIIAGGTPPTAEGAYWDGSNVWITPNDLSSLNTPFIKNSERKISDLGVKKSTGTLLPPNSVILSNRAPVGYCAVVTVPFCCNQGCKGLICNKSIDPLFLYYYLSASTNELEKVSSGTTFLELPKREMDRFTMYIPSDVDVQRDIAKKLYAADERIQTERDYLAKLQNIKRGLMHDLLENIVSVEPLMH